MKTMLKYYRIRNATWTGILCGLVAAGLSAGAAVCGACELSQFEVAEKEPLPEYTVVLFSNPENKADKEAADALAKLEKKWTKRANLAFDTVDVTAKEGQSMAESWQVTNTPTAYVLAPTGWILGAFSNKLDAAAVEELVTSPGKVALKKALKKHTAVYLVLGKKDMEGFEDARKAAREAQKSVKEFMKVDVGIEVVDPTDKREAALLRNLALTEPPSETVVYVTYGEGRAVLQPVQAENLTDRLAFTVQLLGTGDQCSLGQEIFGEPLLLGN